MNRGNNILCAQKLLNSLGEFLRIGFIDGFKEINYVFSDFSPPKINLANLPTESGTFNAVAKEFPNSNIFSSGTYTVTNCIIDDENDIIEEKYVWNIINPINCCSLKIVEFIINDNTACDYYYIEDIYTPKSEFPNPILDQSSTIIVNYENILAHLNFLITSSNNSNSLKSATFYAKIGITNEICIISNHYVKGILMAAGISLTCLNAIQEKNKIDKFKIAYLNYILTQINKAYILLTKDNLGIIPLNGVQGTMNINDKEVAFLISYANTVKSGKNTAATNLNNQTLELSVSFCVCNNSPEFINSSDIF
jgi:hypothetical protein